MDRRRILYLVEGRFQCRKCCNLIYESQFQRRRLDPEMGLLDRRIRNLKLRLERARSPRRISMMTATLNRRQAKMADLQALYEKQKAKKERSAERTLAFWERHQSAEWIRRFGRGTG